MKNVTTLLFVAFALVVAMGIGIPTIAYADTTTTTTIAAPSASFIARAKGARGPIGQPRYATSHLISDVTAATTLSASVSRLCRHVS